MKPTFDEIAALEPETQRSIYGSWLEEAKRRARYGMLASAFGFVMLIVANAGPPWFGAVRIIGEIIFVVGIIAWISGYRMRSALKSMARDHSGLN